ncbi:MAG: signal peptidase I [Candidatus Cloacimonetes bacterium]|nr:signal peptidase I [Candidatus Cloacimonadota bacterium]
MGLFKRKQKRVQRKKNIVQDYFEAILFAFVVAMIIRNYTFQNFMIPSSSMEQTMLIGDYLVAIKVANFFSDPDRGDIVTFRYPSEPVHPQGDVHRLLGPLYWDSDRNFFRYYERRNVVKRVIGIPGDEVLIRDGNVYINGEPYKIPTEQHLDPDQLLDIEGNRLDNPIVWDRGDYPGADVNFGDYDGCVMGWRDNFGLLDSDTGELSPVTVPHDAYFALGDNRDLSLDSRYWGFLPRKYITGTPFLIFFSAGQDPVDSVQELIYRKRAEQRGESIPKRIRWERFMRLVK